MNQNIGIVTFVRSADFHITIGGAKERKMNKQFIIWDEGAGQDLDLSELDRKYTEVEVGMPTKSERRDTKESMDYKNEFKRLQEYVPSMDSEFWSPEPGQYKITALTEIEESEPFEDDKELKPRDKLGIEVNGKKLTWTFALGKSLASTYGQLVQLASLKGGSLKGQVFTVVVVGEGQNKRFTIVA
jgi:hypothetical protein